MALNAALAYQNSKVQTASKADLTLMLYEGAIKFCNIALLALEKNDIQKANTNIIKAERVIYELLATLDFKYPVAKDFQVVYNYINNKLIQANIKKSSEILEEALAEIRDMRDMWKQIMAASKTK
ncbi:flagellar export chaperone FliS [Anaeromicropila populeti]|uniref:Flagellar protein FliS n=1 Tax=Anaeromicropila populeti TaxID=37658 RepID=A0A1I6HXF5_9FIRM|nr:flagellar export chaperone FliS [Anaeromicropila populeti]SFR58910.1 flagellar protein FliS [Anaeromicropila populeti]